MKKLFALIISLLIFTPALSAQQTGTIRGKLTDKATGEAMIGAVLELSNVETPDMITGHASAADGTLDIRSVAYGRYNIRITYMGYKTVETTVDVRSGATDLGSIEMEQDALRIDELRVEGQAIRTSLKGDTVSYNASAFKVAADADVERLIAKMPGITVIDGVVETQGEEVQKVLVDGKEFFGQDVTTALKNLPADVVDRVEVFDKLSDEAEFTGIDDGEGYKAINIVTSLDKRSGQFGKLAASYGLPDYYFGSGSVNIFQGDTRISLLGLANNLNQTNFSFEDIVGATNTGQNQGGGHGGGAARNFMVRPEAGIATVQAFGINYMDKWGRHDKVDVTGSYFFNHSNTVNDNLTQEWLTTADSDSGEDMVIFTDSQAASRKDNLNHRFQARIEYKPSESQSLMIRPRLSYQRYRSDSDGQSAVDYQFANDINEQVSRLRNVEDRRSHAYNAGLNTLYRTRLGKAGRTLTVSLNGDTGLNDGTWLTSNYDLLSSSGAVTAQKIITDSRDYELEGGATYTEPLSERSSLNLEYRADYSYEDSNRWAYMLEEVAATGELIFMNDYDELLSNISNSGYLTQRVSPGFRYNDKKINFNANITYQNAALSIEHELPAPGKRSHNFDNFLYSARLRYNINTANSLNINLNSGTRNPSINQLQDVVNTTNPQRLSAGNSALVPYTNNRLWLRFNHSNAEKGYTFGVNLGGTMTSDYIGNHIHTDEDFVIPGTGGMTLGQLGQSRGSRFTRPENMRGQWNVMAGVSFGMPLKFLKSNFNVQAGGSYSNIPSMIDFTETITRNRDIYARATLGSNISENLDFMLTWSGNFGFVDYSQDAMGASSRIFRQNAGASLKWVIWRGVTFTANASYRQYNLVSEDTNEEYFICNVLIGTKVFKNKRGELSLVVNDLFNQNKSFYTWVTNNAITNSSNSEIGRYVGLQFIYNLRMYGKGASRNSSDYDGLDQSPSDSFRQQGQSSPRPGFHGRM